MDAARSAIDPRAARNAGMAVQQDLAGESGAGVPLARRKRVAALTGCVSRLSSLHPQGHDYYDALKAYAEVYASCQAYLAAEELLAAHDYAAAFAAEQQLLGLVGDDGEPVAHADITEEEIDRCGYMAWLVH